MENYKVKYEMLLEAVNELGSESLKEIAKATKRMVADTDTTESDTSREDIMAIKDTVKRQEAIRENLHLFQ